MSEKKKLGKKVPTAKKRELQNAKRRLRNRSFKSRIRTAIRNFELTLEGNDEAKKQEALNMVNSLVDKAVKNGVYKLNTASRTKSRLSARAKASN